MSYLSGFMFIAYIRGSLAKLQSNCTMGLPLCVSCLQQEYRIQRSEMGAHILPLVSFTSFRTFPTRDYGFPCRTSLVTEKWTGVCKTV